MGDGHIQRRQRATSITTAPASAIPPKTIQKPASHAKDPASKVMPTISAARRGIGNCGCDGRVSRLLHRSRDAVPDGLQGVVSRQREPNQGARNQLLKFRARLMPSAASVPTAPESR
jgi:hypothetical protein